MTVTYEHSWQKVFHEGFAPSLTVEQLTFLRQQVAENRDTLLQGSTTTPPPLLCVQDWPVEAACLMASPGVQEYGGFGHATVGQVEEVFARLCYYCDQRMGEPAACRWLLNWFDETPRDEMRAALLPEIDKAIAAKAVEWPF